MSHTVLIVDDEKSFRDLYSSTLEELELDIITAKSGEEAIEVINSSKIDLIISDVKMPGIDGISLLEKLKGSSSNVPFLMITAYASIKDAVNSLKTGAVDYLEKPIDLDELKAAVSDILNIRKSSDKISFPAEAAENIIAESSIMLNLLNDAYRISKSDVTVLITGESGTGKEILSQFIKKCSDRSDKTLVALNCASIPANIMNSELFGHEKGAFTGAVSKRNGKFREADKGTLFLDEIGDMPLELQSSLLRAIEYNKISPVGYDKEIDVDVRLIAATNKALEEEVKQGTFREDLFYRLNVITLEIPPLRDRIEDILPLARFYLKNSSFQQNKRLSANTIRILQNYSWPGNVRELANAMKRAAILSRTELIMPEHLPPAIKNTGNDIESTIISSNQVQTIEQTEISAIYKALKKTGGNQTKAAQILGISRRTLINKIKKYSITIEI